MSRKLLRNGLAACALAGLLAGPAQAAEVGQRSVTEGLWRWVAEAWQAIRMTIDPDGSNTTNDTRLTIDPNGSNATTDGAEGDIRLTIDPNG